jgi:hypothetical protein
MGISWGLFCRGEFGREMRYWFVSGKENQIAEEEMDPPCEFAALKMRCQLEVKPLAATGTGNSSPGLGRHHRVTEKR